MGMVLCKMADLISENEYHRTHYKTNKSPRHDKYRWSSVVLDKRPRSWTKEIVPRCLILAWTLELSCMTALPLCMHTQIFAGDKITI